MNRIIIVGNPVDGTRMIGPFADAEYAERFAEDHLRKEEYWIYDLIEPSEEAR